MAATWAMVSDGNPVFGTPTAFAVCQGAFTAIAIRPHTRWDAPESGDAAHIPEPCQASLRRSRLPSQHHAGVAIQDRPAASRASPVHPSPARLVVLKKLIEAGRVTPVIDRTFPLSGVSEAIRYLESRQARGKLVVTIGD
jgi:Zinc-binding dehydrogenase